MKIIIKLLFVLLLITSVPAIGFADSPVTSTPIYNAYLDQEIVRQAQAEGTLTTEIVDYLKNPNNPRDFKVAVINALYYQQTWEVRDNAGLYAQQVYDKPLAELKLENLSADELLNLGYMILLDQYTTPEKSLLYLETAQAQEPKSLTLNLTLALAKAQQAMLHTDEEATNPWLIASAVFEDETLTEDIRPEAMEIIKGYLSLYKDQSSPAEQQPDQTQEKALLFGWGDNNSTAVKVYINGAPVYFDVPPTVDLSTNRTLVPFRKIFESLGAEVWFDEDTNSVCGKKGNISIRLPINQTKAYINGQEILLDAPSRISDKRTLVPLRFVSQALGYEVTALGNASDLKVFINTL